MIKNEVGDQSGIDAQKSVRHISSKQAKQLQEKTGKIERAASTALGKVVNFAGNNQNTPVNKIKSEFFTSSPELLNISSESLSFLIISFTDLSVS